MKVRVDTELCSGHGRCYSLAPEVFAPDEEGHSTLIVDDVPEALRPKAIVGEQNCRERAVSVEGQRDMSSPGRPARTLSG